MTATVTKSITLQTVFPHERHPRVRAIQNGLVALIPVLMVGAFALILQSLPLPAWQSFLKSDAGAFFSGLFSIAYHATFGLLSVYMSCSIGYCIARDSRGSARDSFGTPVACLSAFLILIGFLSDGFDLDALGPYGMFVAILCSLPASTIYIRLSARAGRIHVFSDGSDPRFNRALASILPLTAVIVSFACVESLVCLLCGCTSVYEAISQLFTLLFSGVGGDFWGALLYVCLSTLLWFFGIHGSDVLGTVNEKYFVPAGDANIASAAAGLAPTNIYTKTFIDVFTLMGGCGTALCLLLAILLFSRRRSSRTIAKFAAFPMLFNINEIMVFGLPIIYNATLLIPFVLTPVACFLLSTAAMKLGLVPLTCARVEWTTPILIGGYVSTGSAAGAVLQLVELAAGTLIYMPFVRRYDRKKERQAAENLHSLVAVCQRAEEENRSVRLTELEGTPGDIARQLVNDLRGALAKKKLHLVFQPQYDHDAGLFGAEALLRWEHPVFGYVYPPLIIRLAHEGGMLTELERFVFLSARSAADEMPALELSVNATTLSLRDDRFIDFLTGAFPGAQAGRTHICIEVTEQSALSSDDAMLERLKRLKSCGFALAIDDFSMGHTSLKYLQDGDFDLVKLDGALTRRLCSDANTKNIVSSIVYLAKTTGFSVLAEFVETAEQRETLAALGCREYQGYFYSPALPLQDFLTLLRNEQAAGRYAQEASVNKR